MIEAFFGLTRSPFARNLPVPDLFSTPAYEELTSRLQYAVTARQFALVTGEIGSGKSTTIRAVQAGLNPARHQLLYMSDSDLTPRNFFWEALHQLGHSPRFYRGDARRQFNQAIMELVENQGKSVTVVVDEAHLLSREMLEEVRFLLNYRMDSYTPMSLILVGQPELRRTLSLQANEAIDQRVQVRFHLPAFERNQTAQYMEHHLRIAGRLSPLFTEDAVDLIHHWAGGLARKINNLCHHSLRVALGLNRQLIDDHLVRRVLEAEVGK